MPCQVDRFDNRGNDAEEMFRVGTGLYQVSHFTTAPADRKNPDIFYTCNTTEENGCRHKAGSRESTQGGRVPRGRKPQISFLPIWSAMYSAWRMASATMVRV
ncbi:hypothetical protein, partial [Benzoatithermus flavus]